MVAWLLSQMISYRLLNKICYGKSLTHRYQGRLARSYPTCWLVEMALLSLADTKPTRLRTGIENGNCLDCLSHGVFRALLSAYLFLYSPQSMTAYNLKPPDTPPSLAWQEAKEKRCKVLEAVRLKRREGYRQFMQNLQKRQTIANSQEK